MSISQGHNVEHSISFPLGWFHGLRLCRVVVFGTMVSVDMAISSPHTLSSLSQEQLVEMRQIHPTSSQEPV